MRLLRRGLTLAETVVATVLALFLGVLMVKLLSSGLGAHSKGTESRDAQAGVRSLISILVSELRSSSVPPLAEPGVVSPVFWPGVWGALQESPGESEFYPRALLEGSDTVAETDISTNRVIYVRTHEGAVSSEAGPLAGFLLVELFVPQDRPWLVERRFHRLDGLFEPVSDPGRTRFPELFEPGVFRISVAVAVKARAESEGQKAWPEAEDWSTMREESTEIRIPAVRQS